MRAGAVGQAALTRKCVVGLRRSQDHQEYVNDLVETYHIPVGYAQNTRPDTQGWVAMPVAGREEVVAVVYIDTNDHDLFVDNDIVSVIQGGCIGVALYANKYRGG